VLAMIAEKPTAIMDEPQLPKYLSHDHSYNGYKKVNCELLLEHLKENDFELMITHIVEKQERFSSRKRYHILWNKQKGIVCVLDTYCGDQTPDVWRFDGCDILFELDSEYSLSIDKLSSEFAGGYGWVTDTCYHGWIQWRLDVNTKYNTFEKLSELICSDGTTFKPSWDYVHTVSIALGTCSYRKSITEAKRIMLQCPKDFQDFLEKSYVGCMNMYK